MSFDALAWAAKQNPGSSGTKLVLLGLAECADRSHNLAFPSIAALVEFSSLDRKSVIANLTRLEAAGFITDTGRKVGRTGQIKVYQLNIETVPKTEPSQKRNSSDFSAKGPKNGTRNQSEPVISEAKASSARRVFDRWNGMAAKHAGKVRCAELLDPPRMQTTIRRIKTYGEDRLLAAIDLVPKDAWLLGEGRDSKWRPHFDWFLRPDTLRKLLEGVFGSDEDPASSKWTPERMAAYRARIEAGEPVGVGPLAQKILGGLQQ